MYACSSCLTVLNFIIERGEFLEQWFSTCGLQSLQGAKQPFHRACPRPLEKTDICVVIHNSSKHHTFEVAMRIIVWESPQTGGTVLKGLGIRKVGGHCCREFLGSLKSPGRMSNLARCLMCSTRQEMGVIVFTVMVGDRTSTKSLRNLVTLLT